METFFFLSFPLVFLFGFFMFSMSLVFTSLKLSLFIQWDMMLESVKISFPILLDFMSCFFIGLVCLISSSILFYSKFYMGEEIYKTRFFFLMILFVFSMILLILCPSLICMLLGWDGLGLVSYCLVIYYQNFKSVSAGMITALTNRVGDVFILGSISLMFLSGGWSYMNFLNLENNLSLGLFFVIAAMTKSAQIPFSAWLPAAMAAPTPVSSLVHSSTLVTAGVYILIRFSPSMNDLVFSKFLMVISLTTMIMSGVSACYENDLKKIIALSTLSQLGFMMATLSLGLPDLAFFHLCTHACFKALLFMCAGILIHSFTDNQDIRIYGLLNKNFSLILCMFNIANLSLCGFPFLSGFFSKDLVLELMIMSNLSVFIFFLFILGTFLTVLYSFRLFYFLTLKSSFSFPLEGNLKSLGIQKSLFLLFLMSISLGYVYSKLFIFPYNFVVVPLNLKLLIVFICLSAFLTSIFLSRSLKLYFTQKKFILFFHSMWFLTFFKTDFLKLKVLSLGMNSLKLSTGWIESFLGLNLISLSFEESANFTKYLKLFVYLFSSCIALIIIFLSLISH